MDARYINPFISSICNTFETMCNAPVKVGKPTLKTVDKSGADVSSVIGFSGDAAGSVVLRFSFDTASKLASAFAGIDITPEHEDFADALGELANMVAGGAKSKFEGLNIGISLPNVIVGPDHNLSASKNSPRLVIPCETEVGPFDVEVAMELAKPNSVEHPVASTAGATT